MPRYQIQAPDGRTVTVEGDNAPTQDDATKIFSALPAKDPLHPFAGISSKETAQDKSTEVAPAEPSTARRVLETGKSILLNGGGATAGQMIGAMGGPAAIVTVPLGGAIGGGLGNIADQMTRQGQKGIRYGELLAATGLGAIPGASLAKSGGMALAKTAAKQGAAGLLAKIGETEIDQKRLPTIGEAVASTAIPAVGAAAGKVTEELNPEFQSAIKSSYSKVSPKSDTVENARRLGMVVAPSDVNPTVLGNKLEAVAGKAATRQKASAMNQSVVDNVARDYIGLPKDAPLNVKSLDAVREEAGKSYDAIAKLSDDDATINAVRLVNPTAAENITNAADNLQALRQARKDANVYYKHFDKSGDPSSGQKANELSALADKLENQVEQATSYSGQSQLFDDFKNARQRIARSYSLERALNLGDGTISARDIASAYDKGVPISGDMEHVAKFALAFPKSVQDSTKSGGAGVSKLELGLGGLLGAAFGATDHNVLHGVLAAAAPAVAGGSARYGILTKPYQNAFVNVPPAAVAAPQNNLATAIRQLSQAAGQQVTNH